MALLLFPPLPCIYCATGLTVQLRSVRETVMHLILDAGKVFVNGLHLGLLGLLRLVGDAGALPSTLQLQLLVVVNAAEDDIEPFVERVPANTLAHRSCFHTLITHLDGSGTKFLVYSSISSTSPFRSISSSFLQVVRLKNFQKRNKTGKSPTEK